MKPLYYHAPTELAKLMDKCAWAWMSALPGRILITPVPLRLANVLVRCGAVDRSTQADRVAQHDFSHDLHVITLASDVTWRITWWQRVAGIGQQDAYAALLHEIGHALGLPHSNLESDVMAPDLGSTVISRDEAARYCAFLDKPAMPTPTALV